jgi:hypothetical protein
MSELKKWMDLADEAIADAGEWKDRARKAEKERDALLAALQALLDADVGRVGAPVRGAPAGPSRHRRSY